MGVDRSSGGKQHWKLPIKKRGGDDLATSRHGRLGGAVIRALWGGRVQDDYLADALAVLGGWSREGQQLRRTLPLTDAQHAALTERIQVVADALSLRPQVRRLAGNTQIRLGCPEGDHLSEGEVLLAARIEDAYRAVTSDD